jgi:hypothetical protein
MKADMSLPSVHAVDEIIDDGARGSGKPKQASLVVQGLKGHLAGMAAVEVEVGQVKKLLIDEFKKMGGGLVAAFAKRRARAGPKKRVAAPTVASLGQGGAIRMVA